MSFYKTHRENISKARLFFSFILDPFLHDTARKCNRLTDQLISWGFEDSLPGERDFPLCPTEHIAKHFTGGKPIDCFFPNNRLRINE